MNQKKNKFLSFNSSKQPKARTDENVYIYINEDGARITIIKKDNIVKLLLKKRNHFHFPIKLKEHVMVNII